MSKSKYVLPTGITAKDLERPAYDSKDVPDLPYDQRQFELWLIAGFGWVIPTLAISRGGQRTYAVGVGEGGELPLRPARAKRGAQVRCGRGPHVLEQHVVYVRKSRLEVLQPFLDLRHGGAIDANVTRDRISSRRAQGSVERALGHRSWRWNV